MHSRGRRARATLVSVLLGVGSLLAGAAGTAGAHRPARIVARLPRAGLVVHREPLVVRVAVSSSVRTRLRVRLQDAHGRTLALSRTLRVRARRHLTVRLALTPRGDRLLLSCDAARVTLAVHPLGGRVRRTSSRTVPDPVRCAKLRWPPPALDHPQTIALASGGFQHVHLAAGGDYVLRLPSARRVGGVFVEGGRNVVIVGGHITVPTGTTSDDQRRALYFKGQTGVVHVEGVLVDGSAGGEADGIAINAPQATVQIENVRIVDLHGSQRGTHADVVQPWGGVRVLRIDRLTGSSRFQGLQLPIDQGPIGAAFIRYVDLHALAPSSPTQGGGDMLWLTREGLCNGYEVALDHVYVVPRAGRTLRNTVWPPVGARSSCAGVQSAGTVGWPHLPVRGVVRSGTPSGGAYVPSRTVGERYRSPGYEPAATATVGGFVTTTLRALACLAVGRPACARLPRPA